MNCFSEDNGKKSSSIDVSNELIKKNRIILNEKEHVKKYIKYRNLHSDIIDNMLEFIFIGEYPSHKYHNLIQDDIYKETKGLVYSLRPGNPDELAVITELYVYNNHKKIPNVTDLYIKNGKFKSEDKVKMLKSMKESYVGLFKVVDIDKDEGYVYYQDVFTSKKFKIVDIAMSSTAKIIKDMPIYIYNRIITIDGISFSTNIHCMFIGKNNKLEKFIRKHKYNRCSDFSRCLLLYDLCKNSKKMVINYNNNYGSN